MELSRRAVLTNLRNLNQYLGRHPNEESIYFEKLVAEALSCILYLPFYTNDALGKKPSYNVVWNGSINSISKAPQGSADAIAHCYGFYLIIEATRKTGANQWSQEFASAIRHCDDSVQLKSINPQHVYIVLTAEHLCDDTFNSIHNHPDQKYKFIPIETAILARILKTSSIAFTMRHLEFRRLLNDTVNCVERSSCLTNFHESMDILLSNWQKDVLHIEKNTNIGIKSYEVMKKINRTHIGVSEILEKLQKHPTVTMYLKMMDDRLSLDIIEQILTQQCLAVQLSPTYDEKIFYPVPCVDFKRRNLRLIEAMEKIDE